MKTFPKLTMLESMTLLLLAGRMETELHDATLADLIRKVASGDDTALVGACDRLREIGRDADADRLQKLIGV